MEQVSKGPAHQAYILLRIVFIVAPILAGLDKFFDLLVDWDKYLSPFVLDYVAGHGKPLMWLVGVIEVIAGLGIIFKPKVFSYLVALWLALIIANLIMMHNYFDIALRDFGLFLSALALARLAKVCG